MPFGTVTLNDGHEFPTIAFGTGSTMKFRDVTDYVEQAIDTGFWHIDTAQFYQTEEYVGLAIKETGLPRSSLYITTKFSEGDINESVKASLRKLRLEYVDLYLVHFPSALKNIEAGWREIETVKKNGLAMSIGVSNFNLEQLQTLLKTAIIKPVVNQIEFHPYNYEEHKTLLEYCAKHDIVVEAYGSLNSITTHPGGPVDAAVDAAARRLNVTPNQILFSWVRRKGAAIVTTSRSKTRLQEYLAVEDLPPLSDEEIAAIDAAGALGPSGSISTLIRTNQKPIALVAILLFLIIVLSFVGYRRLGFDVPI
ncbi:Aldo/keto reductase [Leucogyrophana mollusca]|uniref:Aldo/keto reductase n=1 Tax=Leucogyrophana mollusca TaxID=85980 RepID=A0ACB8BIE7_9AGAM|nr:Aldo/keto reductase [Leucogyrophana mollusca]